MHIGYVVSNEVAFHSNAYYSSEIVPNVFTFMVNDLPDGDSLCVFFGDDPTWEKKYRCGFDPRKS